MSRSIWKGPNIDANVVRKINASKMYIASLSKEKRLKAQQGLTLSKKQRNLRKVSVNNLIVKTRNRNVHVLPEFIGKTFLLYNGKNFTEILVNKDMVGHRLGEFSFTRKRTNLKKAVVVNKKR
jgi:ribosomal protein S19